MKKKRKHKLTLHDQKIIAARHKNAFMEKLKYFTDLWLGKGSFDMIPEKYHEVIYSGRFTPVRLIAAPGAKIKKRLLDEMKQKLMSLSETKTINTRPGEKISFLEFSTYFMTVHHSIGALLEKGNFEKKILQERYEKMKTWWDPVFDEANKSFHSLINLVTLVYSSPNERYYGITTDEHTGIDDMTGNFKILYLHTSDPVKADFEVNNVRRTAYKMGLYNLNKEVKWISLQPPDTEFVKWRKKYEVYIQAHAIERLYERIDCIEKRQVMLLAFYSLVNPNIIYENGRMLIGYEFSTGCTLGYFVADVTDGKLLIRTFLFLTNDGTPEARRLKEISGMGKLDVKYWNIDKLHHVLTSDIALKPEIKKVFTDAGCGALFTMNLVGDGLYGGDVRLADDLLKYIGQSNEVYEEYEKTEASADPKNELK
jgi:hypothetical protein